MGTQGAGLYDQDGQMVARVEHVPEDKTWAAMVEEDTNFPAFNADDLRKSQKSVRRTNEVNDTQTTPDQETYLGPQRGTLASFIKRDGKEGAELLNIHSGHVSRINDERGFAIVWSELTKATYLAMLSDLSRDGEDKTFVQGEAITFVLRSNKGRKIATGVRGPDNKTLRSVEAVL